MLSSQFQRHSNFSFSAGPVHKTSDDHIGLANLLAGLRGFGKISEWEEMLIGRPMKRGSVVTKFGGMTKPSSYILSANIFNFFPGKTNYEQKFCLGNARR